MSITKEAEKDKREDNKREKVLITLPDRYLKAIDNKIDNVLIRTRGDAIISLLSDLQKLNPRAIEFDEMIYIKSSEFTQLKNELTYIKKMQSTPKAVTNNLCFRCGHPETAHSNDGCLGDGGLCECKEYTEKGAQVRQP